MTAPRPEGAHRRPLPAGYDDDEHTLFVPRPLRSFYVTVTAPPGVTDPPATGAAAEAILDAVCDWVAHDRAGHGDRPRPPDALPPH